MLAHKEKKLWRIYDKDFKKNYKDDEYVYMDYTKSKSNEVNTAFFVTLADVVISSCLLTKKLWKRYDKEFKENYEDGDYVYTDYTESKSNEANTKYFVTLTYVVIFRCLLTKKSSGEDMIKMLGRIMKTMITFIWG